MCESHVAVILRLRIVSLFFRSILACVGGWISRVGVVVSRGVTADKFETRLGCEVERKWIPARPIIKRWWECYDMIWTLQVWRPRGGS